MNADRLRTLREDITASLWFVPAICAAAAMALSFIVPEIDARIERDLEPYRTWIFFGSASAARSMLSVIAGSLITVISLLFSITILTLHQAAAQYTPRIIRTFMNDRTNQAVLGVYIATFLYSVLIMRRIRGEDAPGGESIPMLSVTLSIVLAVVCLMLLVYFIHHIAREFQPATTIGRVHAELLREIDSLYPEKIGAPIEHADQDLDSVRAAHDQGQLVSAERSGFVRMLDSSVLPDVLHDGEWAIVLPAVGSYVIQGQALLEVGGCAEPLDDERAKRLRGAFLLDDERTMTQDALFGVRQLADIALKGLSPSIHDPTTAEQAISVLGDGLACLAQRTFPARVRKVEQDDEDGQTHKRVELWTNRPAWEDFIEEAFSQVRSVTRDNVHVTLHLLDVLRQIAANAPAAKCGALQMHVNEVLWGLERSELSPRDQLLIRESAEQTLRVARRASVPLSDE